MPCSLMQTTASFDRRLADVAQSARGGPAARFIADLGLCAACLQGGFRKSMGFSGAVAEMRRFGLAPAAPLAAFAMPPGLCMAPLRSSSKRFQPRAPPRRESSRDATTRSPLPASNARHKEPTMRTHRRFFDLAAGLALTAGLAIATPAPALDAVAVAPEYDITHVYVAPEDVDAFVQSFTATFGGQSTKQAIATVTPTPSSTSTQLIQTPAGTVSLFGFRTPIPYPFGSERNGYLVTDMDAAIVAARAAGADVIVQPFPDPIGRDAVVQWPGGVNLQLYWHFKKPSYAPFRTVPENRVYVSPDRVAAFVQSFLAFSHGHVISDTSDADAAEIGSRSQVYRRIRIESPFGRMQLMVTDGHLPWPYGRETTGYEVDNLDATLARATAAHVKVLIAPFVADGRNSAIVEFPGGYVAEIHANSARYP